MKELHELSMDESACECNAPFSKDYTSHFCAQSMEDMGLDREDIGLTI